MPLFLDARTGEGRYVAPSPHRPRRHGLHLKRLAVYCIWLDYRRKGLSAADIAELADVSLTTVKDGLREAKAYLVERAYLQRSTHVPALTPMFGADPAWSLDRERYEAVPGGCSTCGGAVRHDSLICAGCLSVTPRNQSRLDHQIDDDEVDAARLKVNRDAHDERLAAEDRERLDQRKAEQERVRQERRAERRRTGSGARAARLDGFLYRAPRPPAA